MVNIKKFLSSQNMDRLEKDTIYVIMAIGISMLGIALVHIFMRYVMNSALTWSEEILKILLIWFSLLSATIISKRSEHIGIVIFRDKMPPKVKKFLLRAVRVLMLLACILVTGIGIVFVINALGQSTPSLKVPYSVCYLAIPVSFLIMSIYEMHHIVSGNFMEQAE